MKEDPKDLTDKQLIKNYNHYIYEEFDMVLAGVCAGELYDRDYEIVELEDHAEFKKKSKKVA